MEFSRKDTKAIKGIAILLMLYHHLFAFPERLQDGISFLSTFSVGGNTISYWIGDFGKLCVAIFLFLGGYGTYLACRNQEDPAKVIFNKVKRLYLSYWKVFVIFIPICLFMGVATFATDLRSFFWNISGINITYNGEWWFFTPFVVLLLLYPILQRQLEKPRYAVLDFLLIMMLHCFAKFIIPNLYAYTWASSLPGSLLWQKLSSAIDLSSCFLIGSLFAKHDLLTKAKALTCEKALFSLLSIFSLFLVFYLRKQTGEFYDYLYAPAFVSFASIILYSCRIGKFVHKILSSIGEESTNIWLIHSFYCYTLCQRLVFMPKYSVLIALWLLILCFASSKLLNFLFLHLYRFALRFRKA